MEVIRQKVGEAGDDLRVRQLRARQLLKGEIEDKDLQEYVESRVLTTTLENAQNWARGNSMFPLGFGLACCAIEMITIIGSPRNDIARFGHEAVRASPRQADMMILSGRVSVKMAPIVRRIYDQMLEPKWVIAMGACSSSAGMFNNYVPGCPPRPEALIYGINKLQKMIWDRPDLGWRERYNADGTDEPARFPEGPVA
jgi:NADH-quinone oxidoreductase subunit B